jgi:serine/threonine protein kinase/Tfp pilus assembly protein PilF
MNDMLVADPADDGAAVAHLHPTTVLPAFAPAGPPASADPPTPSERSDLIDRAYGEYRQLRGAGVAVDPDAFCARFPAFQTSLRRLLEVHREVEENPALLDQLGVRWPQTGDEVFYGFRLLQELGRGAFARVFLARERAVGGRLVAVKVSLHPDNEADTLGKLRHPNVVPIYSTQNDSGTGFSVVCMPFLGSATLGDALEYLATMKRRPAGADALLDAARDKRWQADGAPPAARVYRSGRFVDGVLHIGERLADALAYVHDHGFLHRDLKPSNVLLCPNGEPILLDFNLALDRSMAEHRMGGTLPYMAPEQLEAMGRSRRDPAPADARGDLFALGVILYELLTSAHPFGPPPLKLPASEVRACLLERQRRGPRPLRELNPSVDAGLAALIERCLAFDPAARPASASALRDALRRCQSAPRRAVRWAAAHKIIVAVAGVLFAAGTAGAAYGIATLPSAAERQKQDAIVAAGDGRYDDAVRLFTAALEGDENQPNVYFRRGRAHQLQGNHDLAIQDYLRAEPEKNSKVAACLGYCLSLRNSHDQAIQYYEKALQAGLVSAAVHNNLAFTHLRKRPKYADAHKAATDALDLEPGMLAACYNRALAVHGLWLTEQDPDVMTGIEDVRRVIAGSPGSWRLFQTAAELCAAELQNRGNPPDDPLQAEGETYLSRAVERGQPLNTLSLLYKRMASLKNWVSKIPPTLRVDPSLPKSQGTCDVLLRLVDPLNGQPE